MDLPRLGFGTSSNTNWPVPNGYMRSNPGSEGDDMQHTSPTFDEVGKTPYQLVTFVEFTQAFPSRMPRSLQHLRGVRHKFLAKFSYWLLSSKGRPEFNTVRMMAAAIQEYVYIQEQSLWGKAKRWRERERERESRSLKRDKP